MKLLESIGLVQFFLYEREDLQTGRNTAFLGPNGTGKTALLDALQTVILAADGNRTHFNAASEGKKRARSLRDYCLGVYGQNDSARCRQSANTYINLVFRDEVTGLPVTAGISLAAWAERSEHEFNALYILPGVALTTASQVDTESGHEIVLPWRSFQHIAADLCRIEGNGSTPYFTTNRDEFTRKLLIEHLAGPGDKPNAKALKSAFARSLKLNQDVNDLSETLRQHLIEPRPTNVREFRTRLEQFRDVRDLIKQLKERIERAGGVAEKYAVVQRERTAQANLECLKAVYQTERLGESLDAAKDAIETLTEDVASAELEYSRAQANAVQANGARDRALTALNRDPEYRKQAIQAERLTDLDADLSRKNANLQVTLKEIQDALRTAGQMPELADSAGRFKETLKNIADLEAERAKGVIPNPGTIQQALKALADVYEITRRAHAAAEADHKVAYDRNRDAKAAKARVGKGLVLLRENTSTLQRILGDNGIESKAVCDLLKISDPQWQPIIEAYLGQHVEALLIAREQELDAIDAYRAVKDASKLYGGKLALPSRLREWRTPGGGLFAAELVQGSDRDAIRYLQGALGRTKLAKSSAELRDGEKGLMIEGMVSSGGGVERLRLPGPDELKIGRADTPAMRQHAEQKLLASEVALKAASEKVGSLAQAQRLLAPYANALLLQAQIEEKFRVVTQAAEVVAEMRTLLLDTQTETLVALQAAKAAADSRASAAHALEVSTGKNVATLNERLNTARNQFQGLQEEARRASNDENITRQSPLYDADEVERHRTRLDDRHGDDWQRKTDAINSAIDKAKSTADNADRDGWLLFSTYVSDYHLRNHDINSAQWKRAFQFILDDRKRLQDLELAEQEQKSEEAYAAAVKVFRNDVAQALLSGFDRIKEQMEGLNQVLSAAPAFSNNERYQFRSKPVDEYRSLYNFLKGIRELGSEDSDLFGGGGQIPDEFRALIEGDSDSELLAESSPLNDHRRFFSYDVEIFQSGSSIGWLSKRLGPGSGGEHRTPLYVIFGAALAAAYGKVNGSTRGGGIMLLDEAFEKMDPQNVRATAEYLNALGLQLIMAGPETDQPKMSSFMDIYYDMARFGTRTIQMTKNVLTERARELLQSDNYLNHPELLASEIERFRVVEEAGNVSG